MMASKMTFHLPSSLNASEPPERRGIRRDHVKLMVIDRTTGHLRHDTFFHLDRYLRKGDVLVLNNSRTLPAILRTKDGTEIRLSRKRGDADWEAWVSAKAIKHGDGLDIADGFRAEVINKVPSAPLWTLRFSKSGPELYDEIYRHGEPVRYEYITTPWDLEYYQTVYASVPGSVEMPSAGRAFSWELLFKLRRRGVRVVFLQLHTGLSYLMDDEWNGTPSDCHEAYSIPPETMEAIQEVKASGHRVIAAGTTVVRALETAALHSVLEGSTNLYVRESFPLQIVDGILTGFHEPKASHLDMLSAFIAPGLLHQAYEEAITHRYLWHEFGDANLIL